MQYLACADKYQEVHYLAAQLLLTCNEPELNRRN